MSDSEEDYMSDKLLAGCEGNDIRPGLVFKQTEKRQLDIYKKEINMRATKKLKSYKEQENEAREKGLNTAISTENKGFKLLEKMGYKPGTSLGKSTEGIKEPIIVNVKNDSGGIGRKEHVKNIIKKKSENKEKVIKQLEEEFKATNAEKIAMRYLHKDMYKAQKICEELDFRMGIKEPILDIYWTPDTVKKLRKKSDDIDSDLDESDEEPTEITENDLKNIIEYLRKTHYYCMYCVVTFNGDEDLNENCPGSYRDDHDE